MGRHKVPASTCTGHIRACRERRELRHCILCAPHVSLPKCELKSEPEPNSRRLHKLAIAKAQPSPSRRVVMSAMPTDRSMTETVRDLAAMKGAGAEIEAGADAGTAGSAGGAVHAGTGADTA